MRSDRNDRPTTGQLRRRLLRLAGLPIRPATARLVVAEALERGGTREISDTVRRVVALDPGLALRAGRGTPLRWVERLTWWDPAPKEDEARARVWRHAVAVSLAAGRLGAEAGLADPDGLARIGLLADLGWWALVVEAPEVLSELLDSDSPTTRRERLGSEVSSLGRELAELWGCDAEVRDAAWLGSLPPGSLSGCSGDPQRLRLVQRAYALAEQTCWRLGPSQVDSRVIAAPLEFDESHAKRLAAEVEARCARPFVEPEDAGLSRRACRRAARLIRLDRQARRERDREAQRLDAVVEEHRQTIWRAETESRRGRLDALAEFAAGAGHELNNPLAVVQGRAQILLARTADPEAIRSLRAIIAQAQRAHRLLRDLMYVARPPSPRCLPCLPFDLARGCLRDLQAEAESRGVTLRFECDDPGLRTWTDPDALRHLIEALARNAIEATPGGGQVVVTGREALDQLILQFRDEGRGLNEEFASHMFDPFYCGRQAGRGLGMGLPRVAGYLSQVGGRIGWHGEPGGGSSFTVAVPLASPPEDKVQPSARSA